MGRKAVHHKGNLERQGCDVGHLAKCLSPGLSTDCVAVHGVHELCDKLCCACHRTVENTDGKGLREVV